MATLLSNAFGRKNLLAGVGVGRNNQPPAEKQRQLEERAREDSTVSPRAPGPPSREGDAGLGISVPGSRDGGGGGGGGGSGSGGMFAAPQYPAGSGKSQGLFGAAPGNPMNQPLWTPTEANRAAPYAVSDPVSMHLLMENALEDSRRFEVLSEDDVMAARTELESLVGRIEAAQRKLALETKVRDASQSMNQMETIEEHNQAAQRCEALQDELMKLRDQEQVLQRRLLEHTAGVLQMTHKGYLKGEAEANGAAEGTFDHSHFYEPSMLLDSLDSGGGKLTEEQENMIRTIQQRVEDLNGRIRRLLRDLNAPPRDVPAAPRNNNDPEEAIENTLDQVNSLDQCFVVMQTLQSNQKHEQTLAKGKADEATRSLGDMNQNLYRTIKEADRKAAIDAPPTSDAGSLTAQLLYLEQVQRSIRLQGETVANYDEVIAGLWQMLSKPDDGDYSLMSFSSKVQEMNIKFSSLQDQKTVLQRQIQQQREANDAEAAGAKEAEIADLKDQLEKAQMDLETTEKEMDAQLENLSSTITDLETNAAAMTAEYQAEKDAATKELQSQKNALTKELESEKTSATKEIELQREVRRQAEERAQKAQAQLDEANNLMKVNSEAIKADLEAKTKAAAVAESSLHEIEGEVARLQTELTIAKAELDGAYGTRAERAAERDPEMQERVKQLEKELEEMNADYEAMTKATIEHEKEKDDFETQADILRDRVESLEAELQEERVQQLGSKGGEGGGTSTSAAVLRNEFKKMMKDAREGHSKALKVSVTVSDAVP